LLLRSVAHMHLDQNFHMQSVALFCSCISTRQRLGSPVS
jgi:hypothetical protein